MTATYTTPRTWATGDLVTAAMMNQQVRDNFEALKDPPTATADDNASAAFISSTSFQDITGATGTITTFGGRVQVGGMLSALQGGATQNVPFTILIDGVNQGDATNGMFRNYLVVGAYETVTFNWFSAVLSAGSHTIKLQARSPNSNGIDIDHVHFYVREVS